MAARLCALALMVCCTAALAQSGDAVMVTALRDPVDKSYRKMVSGMALFEKRRELAPGAELRFRLLPRRKDTRMEDVDLAIVGDTFETPLKLLPDQTFAVPLDEKALKENASVRPNRKAKTMTWRAEIRTPGLPAGTRRLGDLRLECEVGMEAGLISNNPPGVLGWAMEYLGEGPGYCHAKEPRYLFFADRPLWSVTLTSGARTEVLPVARLHGGISRDPKWRETLPYCDCEVLVDRAYFMPLGDRSWPDDTLVRFEYMEDR